MAKLDELRFANTYARLPHAFYSKLAPTPLAEPHFVSFNPAAAALVGLDASEAERPEFVEAFGGGSLPRGAEPLAMLYAGHQFGTYVPQLGDGRAVRLPADLKIASLKKYLTTQSALSYIHSTRPDVVPGSGGDERLRCSRTRQE